MKDLTQLLSNINHELICRAQDAMIESIEFDSRACSRGALFVAVKGYSLDGHDYVKSAYENGCRAFLVERKVDFYKADMYMARVEDSSEAMALLSDLFFDSPSKELKLVGITGTNGKTTCATLMYDLFKGLGYQAGLLSTVVNKIGDEEIKATHTTPNPVALNKLLRQMVDAKCTHCFMEVSSHAIDQNRVFGLSFSGGVFTNISHDHLDYHKTFAAYIKAKKQFFDQLPKSAFALVNTDDKNGLVMLQNTRANQVHYALKTPADFKAKVLENELSGLVMNLDDTEFYSRLIGRFNAYNLLAVYAVATLLGQDKIETLGVLSNLQSVAGRFQYLKVSGGPTTIVDYAHTPDALKNVLETIKAVKQTDSRLITVIGCGGDRDKEKRPIMAAIASDMSEQLILTSDNPRTEAPSAILNDMQKGLDDEQLNNAFVMEDRKEAIKLAVKLANESDVILIAGKGHEKYQEIDGVRYDFDDYEIASEFTNQMTP